MALEHLDVGTVAVGLIADGDASTPWVAGTLTFEADRGVVVEVPYLDHVATVGSSEHQQFAHVEQWFAYGNPTPPKNLLMRLQAGDVSLLNCRMTSHTSNAGRGSAFGRIGADHVVLAHRDGDHDAPLLVNRLRSRVDGLKEWSRLSAVTEEVFTHDDTGLIKAVHLKVESEEAITWEQGDARMSIESRWHTSGPRELRVVHDDVVLVSEFDEPRPVEDHLAAQRLVVHLLVVLFGAPVKFRQHHVSSDQFAERYGQRVHTLYKELITRSTYQQQQEPAPSERQLRDPLLWPAALGAPGLERWAERWDDWKPAVLPLVGLLQRPGAAVEDVVVSANMALEAAGYIIGKVPGEEDTYTRGQRRRPTAVTYVFRVLADLGISMPQIAHSTIALARAIVSSYNAIKHYNNGQFPDVTETYLASRLAALVARHYLAKLVLDAAAEDADPSGTWSIVIDDLRNIEMEFEDQGLSIDEDGKFIPRLDQPTR